MTDEEAERVFVRSAGPLPRQSHLPALRAARLSMRAAGRTVRRASAARPAARISASPPAPCSPSTRCRSGPISRPSRSSERGQGQVALWRSPAISDCNTRRAFVLAHKMREAMASELKGAHLGGEGKTAEVDGGYFGGYVKPANHKENRRDRRLAKNQNRQAQGRGRDPRARRQHPAGRVQVEALRSISSAAASRQGPIVIADEAGSWNELHARFAMKRINHQEAYSPRRRLHELGRRVLQPHASRRDRPPPPYRRGLPAPLRARGVLARGSPPRGQRRTG